MDERERDIRNDLATRDHISLTDHFTEDDVGHLCDLLDKERERGNAWAHRTEELERLATDDASARARLEEALRQLLIPGAWYNVQDALSIARAALESKTPVGGK